MAEIKKRPISKRSQDALLEFNKQCSSLFASQWRLRDYFKEIDLSYMREKDLTIEHSRAKTSNKLGDSTKFQNITVPEVLPAVEAAVTYQSSVFLSGTPIFGVVASPQYMDAAIQMESIIDDQAVRGGWARELIKAFRDTFKYNLAAVEIDWISEKLPSYTTDPVTGNITDNQAVVWSGNSMKHLNVYNTFWDHRVSPVDVPAQGEFAGYSELISRVELKKRINKMTDVIKENIISAFNSSLAVASLSDSTTDYYVPSLNPNAMVDKTLNLSSTNWLAWAELSGADKNSGIQYKNMYNYKVLYGRIIPSDFGIITSFSNTPQIWKFIIINNSVCIYAEKLTNVHDLIPILFMQANEDGLAYQTKSLAENVRPIQEVTTALVNSIIAARRRAISDRGIYNPLLVEEKHINSDNPSAKIPLRAAAYNKSPAEAYYPVPFRDDQTGVILQEFPLFSQMANKITGQNPARQGQFVKGNKTRSEFQEVMSNANGRDQLTSILLESQFFTPAKEIIKSNILQYQQSGEIYSRAQESNINVDIVKLRSSIMQFKVADGLTPVDKLMDGDSWQVALQTIGSSPQIGQGYNIAPMFSYLMKTRGAKITEFEKSKEQIAYEQALGAWQQAAMEAAKAGTEFKSPQPTPEQYGYQIGAQSGVTSPQ